MQLRPTKPFLIRDEFIFDCSIFFIAAYIVIAASISLIGNGSSKPKNT